MAQRTHVIITDDLDGTEGARTHRFAWGDTGYEIDMSDAHRDELLRALEPYITAARKTPTTARRRTATSSTGAAEVRAWARANGYQVTDRGRVPETIQQAYANR